MLLYPATNNYNVSLSQDSSGNYKIQYNLSDFIKVEERHYDASLSGSYFYTDTTGKPQTISYIAGNNGLKVISSTVLPEDVADVKRQHLEEVSGIIEELEGRLAKIRPSLPFKDDVVKVTIEHLKAVEIAKIAALQGGIIDCDVTDLSEPNITKPV